MKAHKIRTGLAAAVISLTCLSAMIYGGENTSEHVTENISESVSESTVGAEVTSYKDQIEQVYVNKPEITVWYRTSSEGGTVSAALNGASLELKETIPFVKTMEPVHYYVLLDTSGSIHPDRFQNLQNDLVNFVQEAADKGDTIRLSTFADKAKNFLDGDEEPEAAKAKLWNLANGISGGEDELIFDVLEQAADDIVKAQEEKAEKWVLVVIAAGEDFKDAKTSVEDAVQYLTAEGVPVYTVAVENGLDYERPETEAFKKTFGSLAEQTGGIGWDSGWAGFNNSAGDALASIGDAVRGSYEARFVADDNRADGNKEELAVTFPDGETQTREIKVDKSQPDKEAPTAEVEAASREALRVIYSEAVDGGDKAENYAVEADGTALTIKEVTPDEHIRNAYLINTEEAIRNTTYKVAISNVKDRSVEGNALATTVCEVPVTDLQLDTSAPTLTDVTQWGAKGFTVVFSEQVVNAEKPENYSVIGNGKSVAVSSVLEAEEANTYYLVTKKKLGNGTYIVKAGGDIRDASPEANPLGETEKTVQVSGVKRTFLDVLARWWPLLVTILVLAFILILVLILRKKRKRKNRDAAAGMIPPGAGDMQRAQYPPQRRRPIPGEKNASYGNAPMGPGPGIQAGVRNDTFGAVGNGHVNMMTASAERVPAAVQNRNSLNVILYTTGKDGTKKRIEHTISGSCFVGRSAKMCELSFDDNLMSKQHFNLGVEPDGGVSITDLGSTNGTSVNGQRIQGRRMLKPGDRITAGSMSFVIDWQR